MASPWHWPLVHSVAFWLLASLLVGALANQLPPRWLERFSLRPEAPERGPEAQGRVGRAGPLAIRTWKRWIPDAGGALPGGVRKATLVRRDPESLRRLTLETWRAELVHWALLPAGLITGLWLPPPGMLVNLMVALVLNLPCLLLQRFNRSRLQRCLARMERDAGGGAQGQHPQRLPRKRNAETR